MGDSPLDFIRKSTKWVTEHAKHVQIGKSEAFKKAASMLVDSGATKSIPSWLDGDFHFFDGTATTYNYVFTVDAINFCFWPSKTGLEYDILARAVRRIATEKPSALSPAGLAKLTEDELDSWFPPDVDVPELAERARLLRQVGSSLQRSGYSSAMDLVIDCRGSAAELVRRVTAMFPGFRDETVYAGRQIGIYKRAQILAADLWLAFGCQTRKKPAIDSKAAESSSVAAAGSADAAAAAAAAASGGAGSASKADGGPATASGESGSEETPHPCAFWDADQLTMFADYRVPQPLRELGLLLLSEELGRQVDGGEEVPSGSEQEVELRAASIQCVERLKDSLAEAGHPLASVQIDWWLWTHGEANKDKLPPHHRTRTVFY